MRVSCGFLNLFRVLVSFDMDWRNGHRLCSFRKWLLSKEGQTSEANMNRDLKAITHKMSVAHSLAWIAQPP